MTIKFGNKTPLNSRKSKDKIYETVEITIGMEGDRYNKLKEIVLTSLNDICEFEDETKDRYDINPLREVMKFFSTHSL